MKKLLILFVFLTLFLSSTKSAQAIVDPLSSPNNHFGIHILDENNFEDAANLVNSNGGEWGYVTFVIREDERDLARWTRAFNQLKDLRLIPLVRLATTNQNGIWTIPSQSEAQPWAKFLNALPWPTQNRYVILFNEPNHAKEWGDQINPQEYTQISRIYWEQLKRYSPDFFILPAGFDSAASNSPSSMSETDYLAAMYQQDDLIFTIFDGWTSHSYPNPNFCGSPNDTGKTSIKNFEWEVNLLKNYHYLESRPIFITETGWKCQDQDLTSFYQTAFSEVWNDPRIVAITPFILQYDYPPFDNFSWINPHTNEYSQQYLAIQNMTKTKGTPI